MCAKVGFRIVKRPGILARPALCRYHSEPGLLGRLHAASTLAELRALLRQLRDDGTLTHLAQASLE
jgi:hypothetical protein